MDFYGILRKQYAGLKSMYRKRTTPPLSKVRRITRVFPPKDTRLVAMTFDDGPTSAPANPFSNLGITRLILDAMAEYKALGTFNIIGSTEENYPDKEGKPGSFKWGGIKYDHYPRFGQDSKAGAANQSQLLEELIRQGHEVSNHGYRHVAFGAERLVYNSRAHFPDRKQALDDARRLHSLLQDEFRYTMTLARPPHYIDKTPDGFDAYDMYEELGYQYLGASFDGGGWRASKGDFHEDVHLMIAPLKRALEEDPDSLNGQIIFEKDGYNMSLEAPVVAALPEKLRLLKIYDYRVVTVSQLLTRSQFLDVDPSSDIYKGIMVLLKRDKPVMYRDNTFRAHHPTRLKEAIAWLGPDQSPRSVAQVGISERKPVTPKILLRIAAQKGVRIQGFWKDRLENPVPRWQTLLLAAEALS